MLASELKKEFYRKVLVDDVPSKSKPESSVLPSIVSNEGGSILDSVLSDILGEDVSSSGSVGMETAELRERLRARFFSNPEISETGPSPEMDKNGNFIDRGGEWSPLQVNSGVMHAPDSKEGRLNHLMTSVRTLEEGQRVLGMAMKELQDKVNALTLSNSGMRTARF